MFRKNCCGSAFVLRLHVSPLSIIFSLSSLGYELLFQPEVVRVYTSLLKESKNPTVLEATAGAIQNLCAGRWTVRTVVLLLNFSLDVSGEAPDLPPRYTVFLEKLPKAIGN